MFTYGGIVGSTKVEPIIPYHEVDDMVGGRGKFGKIAEKVKGRGCKKAMVVLCIVLSSTLLVCGVASLYIFRQKIFSLFDGGAGRNETSAENVEDVSISTSLPSAAEDIMVVEITVEPSPDIPPDSLQKGDMVEKLHDSQPTKGAESSTGAITTAAKETVSSSGGQPTTHQDIGKEAEENLNPAVSHESLMVSAKAEESQTVAVTLEYSNKTVDNSFDDSLLTMETDTSSSPSKSLGETLATEKALTPSISDMVEGGKADVKTTTAFREEPQNIPTTGQQKTSSNFNVVIRDADVTPTPSELVTNSPLQYTSDVQRSYYPSSTTNVKKPEVENIIGKENLKVFPNTSPATEGKEHSTMMAPDFNLTSETTSIKIATISFSMALESTTAPTNPIPKMDAKQISPLTSQFPLGSESDTLTAVSSVVDTNQITTGPSKYDHTEPSSSTSESMSRTDMTQKNDVRDPVTTYTTTISKRGTLRQTILTQPTLQSSLASSIVTELTTSAISLGERTTGGHEEAVTKRLPAKTRPSDPPTSVETSQLPKVMTVTAASTSIEAHLSTTNKLSSTGTASIDDGNISSETVQSSTSATNVTSSRGGKASKDNVTSMTDSKTMKPTPAPFRSYLSTKATTEYIQSSTSTITTNEVGRELKVEGTVEPTQYSRSIMINIGESTVSSPRAQSTQESIDHTTLPFTTLVNIATSKDGVVPTEEPTLDPSSLLSTRIVPLQTLSNHSPLVTFQIITNDSSDSFDDSIPTQREVSPTLSLQETKTISLPTITMGGDQHLTTQLPQQETVNSKTFNAPSFLGENNRIDNGETILTTTAVKDDHTMQVATMATTIVHHYNPSSSPNTLGGSNLPKEDESTTEQNGQRANATDPSENMTPTLLKQTFPLHNMPKNPYSLDPIRLLLQLEFDDIVVRHYKCALSLPPVRRVEISLPKYSSQSWMADGVTKTDATILAGRKVVGDILGLKEYKNNVPRPTKPCEPEGVLSTYQYRKGGTMRRIGSSI